MFVELGIYTQKKKKKKITKQEISMIGPRNIGRILQHLDGKALNFRLLYFLNISSIKKV